MEKSEKRNNFNNKKKWSGAVFILPDATDKMAALETSYMIIIIIDTELLLFPLMIRTH